ncbi:hypothetical protein FACS1894133_5360 [Clostridia bacterium]|nr:hypothetical protein FACS1894133_5360 [Clostridia bacterium]
MNKKVTKNVVALAVAGVVVVSVLTGCVPPSAPGADTTESFADIAKVQAHKANDLPNGRYHAYGDTARPYFEVADGVMTLKGFTPALHEEILLGIYDIEESLSAADGNGGIDKGAAVGIGKDDPKSDADIKAKLRTMYDTFNTNNTFTYNVWDSPLTGKFIAAGERAGDGDVYTGDSALINLVEADDTHGYTFVLRFGEEDVIWHNLAIPFKLSETNDSLVYNPTTDAEDIDLLSDTTTLPHAKSDIPVADGAEAVVFPFDIPMTPVSKIQAFIAAGKKDIHTPATESASTAQ